MAVVFDSLDHPPGDRVDVARTVLQEQSAPSTVSFDDSPDVVAVMEAWDLGDAGLFCASMTGNRLRRTARDVRTGPAGTVGVAVQTFGVGRFEQFGHQRVVRAGDIMIVDLDAPYDFGWRGWGRSRCLHVPAETLGLSHEQIRSAAIHIDASPLYPIVRRHIDDLCIGRDAEVPAGAARSLGASSVTLVRSLLTTTRARDEEDEEGAAPDPALLVRRVDHFLASHLIDPDLTVGAIAAGVGVSEPDLLRTTMEAGVDLLRWIEARRLSLARAALADSPTRPDPAFARAHGFPDLGSFAAAFSMSYGLDPRDWWALRDEW
ncbi:helix-turn-helix domain-containing protein [Gordonia rhizosphera]|uniref:Putative AraC family transcriptional regulator n=1 Tax=Gordonia rhizosphera NBRC 16068 TaxID=1108045 RepID=K6W3E0_9ACTN|nr:helix-turn-helix domain-containing protein [Gordonia rhizosphera]GAB88231.1 putative AraC family transcriptional regulator [Gordonia rhizosphera NBRC 16068]